MKKITITDLKDMYKFMSRTDITIKSQLVTENLNGETESIDIFFEEKKEKELKYYDSEKMSDILAFLKKNNVKKEDIVSFSECCNDYSWSATVYYYK